MPSWQVVVSYGSRGLSGHLFQPTPATAWDFHVSCVAGELVVLKEGGSLGGQSGDNESALKTLCKDRKRYTQ